MEIGWEYGNRAETRNDEEGKMKMMITSSLSILLVTECPVFFSRCRKELWDRFHIDVYRFAETDLKESLRTLRPCVIIWDSRMSSGKWRHFITWMHDHFNGRPIIAVTQGDDEEFCDALHRQGIHLQLDYQSPSFFKLLQVHVFAILLDYETDKSAMMEKIVL